MANVEAPKNFEQFVRMYGVRRTERQSQELKDQQLILQLAIAATESGNPDVAEAANSFLDTVRNGSKDPVKDFLETHSEYSTLQISGQEEQTHLPEPTLNHDPVNTETFVQSEKLAKICDEYPAIMDLFTDKSKWQIKTFDGKEGFYIKRSELSQYFVPKRENDLTGKGQDMKMAKMAEKWKEAHNEKPLGIKDGITIFISKEETEEFFVWLEDNPQILSSYTIVKKNQLKQ